MGEAGIEEQAPGDSVWSDVVTPTWTRANGSWSATVTAPTGLDLRDGALYDVAIVATDPLTGLSSGTSRATLRIAWSRKATEPTGVTVHARREVSADGTSDIWARMTLPQASGLAAADLLDVWRVTADGSERIAHRVAGGSTVIDHYAPYGGSPAYRIVRVTADGDAAWFEYPYQLSAQMLRIDFGSDYVELPYNLKLGSGWGKDFEARQHLDGSVDGYWNRAVRRTATLGSAVVRADGSETAALRRLAAYAGPCFVRNPDGEAFEANVEVSGLDRIHNDGSVTVSMSVEGVSLTDEYTATVNT